MPGPVLICAATARELDAARGLSGEDGILAVTGAGIPLAMARLTALVAERRPALIVNVGIAGAYPGSGLAIGDVVAGESEAFGDLGMELPGPGGFLPIGEASWADAVYRRPLPLVTAPFGAVPARTGKGCTVNACAGTRATGELRRRLFGADFESMEGAAAALAGSLAGVPVAEIRAISNFASDRDMRPEHVELALRSLRACLEALGKAAP